MTQHKILSNSGFDGENFILSIIRQFAWVFVTLHQVQ